MIQTEFDGGNAMTMPANQALAASNHGFSLTTKKQICSWLAPLFKAMPAMQKTLANKLAPFCRH